MEPNSTHQGSQTLSGRFGTRRLLIAAVLVLIVFAFISRSVVIGFGARRAGECLSQGRVGDAEAWLDWCETYDADNWQMSLLWARAYRLLGDQEGWEAQVSLASMRRPGPAVELEKQLGNCTWGKRSNLSPETVLELVNMGAPPHDAVHAVVEGMIAFRNVSDAGEVLDQFSARIDEKIEMFLASVMQLAQGQHAIAKKTLEAILENSPNYEPAKVALARSLIDQFQLDAGVRVYTDLFEQAPQRRTLRIEFSRALRSQGESEQARRVMLPVIRDGPQPLSIAIEMGTLESETGNHAKAVKWFQDANLDRPLTTETLRIAGNAYSFAGDRAVGQELLRRADEGQKYARMMTHLQDRLQRAPSDPVAIAEWQVLSTGSPPQSSNVDPTKSHVSPIYLENCAVCHGVRGDGQGRASRFLFPRARNLRQDSFRLVTTRNRVPSTGDIVSVIRNGIPGTSMTAFPDFSAVEVEELVRQVQKFREEGARSRIIEVSTSTDELTNDEIEEVIAGLTTPGEDVKIPELSGDMAKRAAFGKEVFLSVGCQNCHFMSDSIAKPLHLFDESGEPTVARDLQNDPLKGGDSITDLCIRIRLGMPGSAHPASPGLSDSDLLALAAYCLSLRVETPVRTTNAQRISRVWEAFRESSDVEANR